MKSENKGTITVFGKNTVRESVRSGEAVELFVSSKYQNDAIVKEAQTAGIEVNLVSWNELDALSKSTSHQGYVAICHEVKEYTLAEVIEQCKQKENPLILMLDGIEDPHNVGAILRSVDAFGVDAVILKNRGEAKVNSTVAKVSTGAIHYVRICTVANLTNAIQTLKKNGFWVVSSDGSGKTEYDEVDYSGPMVIVVGSEGFGISNLVLKNSDFIVKIPMVGHVNSLNASVATGILLAGVTLLRKKKK
ncbi:MAG: 23S rRNA (guanosine(2251)-2'-O)-methyltransferase RlmB [Bacilli bacterium]|nr:23S rRNA (guanosine(2251)-2'-O)-methyltransferase RlmB [Bacilli bacterium]